MAEQRCEKHRHFWLIWEQGGHIINNGIIPGTKCICEQKILIEKFCSKCFHREVIAVETKSQAALDYMNGIN